MIYSSSTIHTHTETPSRARSNCLVGTDDHIVAIVVDGAVVAKARFVYAHTQVHIVTAGVCVTNSVEIVTTDAI